MLRFPKKCVKLSKYLRSIFGLRQGEKYTYNSYEEVEMKFAHDTN